MRALFRKALYYYNKPYIGFPLSICIGYLVMYYLVLDVRKLYKINFNCVEVVKVNDTSDYKTQPSIIVSEGLLNFEIYQFYSYDYDFKQFEVGDMVCKEANNFNFIRIKKDNTLDTIIDDSRRIVSALLFMPLRPYDESKLKCDCIPK